MYLGVNNQKLTTIKDVAETYGISKNHLMKVVQELSAQSYVEATRGKNGGIRLNRRPNQINVGKLVRKFEQNSMLVECFGENNQCVITPACQLKHMFSEALNEFFTCLEQYTLADLISGSNKEKFTEIFVSSHAVNTLKSP